MKKTEISRRDFTRLTTAAVGGMFAGAIVGCNQETTTTPAPTTPAVGEKHEDDPAHFLMEGPNVCRGLNHTCKGHKGGDNACAGQGACATAKAHECAEANDCKGQGGCGNAPGQNECKGKGKCAVPLKAEAWQKARAAFEAEMKLHEKPFGEAPAAG